MSNNPYRAPSSSFPQSTLIQRNHTRSLWMGAVLAPLATPIAAVPLAVFLDPPPYSGFIDALIFSPFVAIASIIWGYLGTISIGLPTALLLQRLGHLSALLLCTASLPLGVAFWLTLRWFSPDPFQLRQSLAEAFVFAGTSLTVAVAFCLASGITIRSSRTPIATRLGSA